MALSEQQRMALAITPKFSGALSMAGSMLIIRDVITQGKHKTSTYHRLLMGMSAIDTSISFWFAMSTWPIPEGSPLAWGAVGNQATCTLQGTLGQMSVGTPMYNASLGIFYMLLATFKWDEERIRRRAEPFMHLIPLGFSVGTALAGLPLKLYNNSVLWCWFARYPLNCKESFEVGRDEANCIRGDNASLYRLVFWFGPVWISTFVATATMVVIYCTVLKKERAVDSLNPDGVTLRKQSRRIAAQAFWYLLAMWFVFTPSTVGRIHEFLRVRTPYWILFSMTLIMPSQGFLNYMVYTRSNYVSYRRAHPDATPAQALRCVTLSKKSVKSDLSESVPPEKKPISVTKNDRSSDDKDDASDSRADEVDEKVFDNERSD